jgi:UDP-N-acetylmuramate dehydrogenase
MNSLEELKKNLDGVTDVELKLNLDLTRFSTMKLKASGHLILIKSVEALKFTLKQLHNLNLSYKMLGWGANLIIPENPNFIFIKLELPWNQNLLNSVQSEYHLSASTPLNQLTSHAMKFGLKGWETFTGIPASLGGAIFMNAGTNLGEIGSIVKEVTLITSLGQEKVVSIGPKSFSYRENHFVEPGDVIISARLIHLGIDSSISAKIKDYLKLRNDTQPLTEKTCGCVFKNASPKHRAGQMIDLMKLKGLELNGLKVSHKHANFMENRGEATAADFHRLSQFILSELQLSTGIEFELEVKID